MKDLTGNRFGRLVVVGPPFKKGGRKYFVTCRCDCGNTKDVTVDNLVYGNTSSCGCSRITDLTGQRFGQLVVVELHHIDDMGSHWVCQCDCGISKVIRGNSLKTGDTKTCGHTLDLVGQRFGKLTVIGKDKSAQDTKQKRVWWTCQCDCGKMTSVSSDNLKSGNTASCGCLKYTSCLVHGMTNTSTYKVWSAMIQRCNNSNDPSYRYYGGRGITVCDRWRVFSNFFEDMGEALDGLEIDRIDNSKGYYKENCRWVTRKENTRNTRGNRYLEFKGLIKCITEWSELTGINVGTIRDRLNKGWPVDKALTVPTRRKSIPKIKNSKFKGARFLTMGDKTLRVDEWAEETRIKRTTIIERLKRGWSVEKALTTPPKEGCFSKKK